MVPDKVERLCRRAQQAIAERDWDKAKQGYLMALAMRSDLPDVHYGLATVYFQQRELTSAAHHFREVTRLEPNRAGAHINLGAVLNLLNQYDEAIAALRRGIQLDPQRVEGYYNLGLVYRRKGQADLAITAYREAIRLNPRMADAHLNLANLYLERENARMALNHYQQAAQLRPNWDKALEGIEQAKAILEDTQPASPAQSPAQPAAASVIESDKFVDPVHHANFLTTLHSSASVAEDTARLLQKIVGEEIDPVLKELSYALMHTHGSRSELDNCLSKFETALGRLRSARAALKQSMTKISESNNKFPTA